MSKRTRAESTEASKAKSRSFKKAESETTQLEDVALAEEDTTLSGFDCKYIPRQLKFREWECNQITEFIEGKPEKRFLMVTGLPGSGKTLFVTHLLGQCSQLVIQINAMSCKNYHDFLAEVLSKLHHPPKKGESKAMLKNKLTTALCEAKREM